MRWEEMTVGQRIGLGFTAVLVILAVLGVLALFGVNGIVKNAGEVIGGNRLDGDLAQKEVDHLSWAAEVNTLLTDEKVTKLDVQLDYKLCGFGKWYYGEGRREAEKMAPSLAPIFQKIEEPHKRLHESAAKISAVFRQPHPGLTLTLSNRLADHLQWVSDVNRKLATEAGGLYTYQAQVKNIIDEAFSIVQGLDADASGGTPVVRQAKTKKILESIRFGLDTQDYVFVIDTQPVMLVHPTQDLIGKNLADSQDPNGKKLFMEMVKICQEKGEGFLTYYWPKPGSDKPVPKMTYVKIYKPWGWILGTGVFLNVKNQALLARADDFAQNKPFSLGVQIDPAKCAFGRFLNDPATSQLKSEFPEFKAAMEAVEEPHHRLHNSAAAIERAINELDMQGAIQIFNTQTLPALEGVKEHLHQAIAAEEKLAEGFSGAQNIYAVETVPNLKQVQKLLHEIRAEAKKHIMTDEVMLAAAQGTRRNVIIFGILAVLVGIALALFIRWGLVRTLTQVAEGIGGNADQVVEAAGQVSGSSQQLAEGASEQAASLEETSSSLEEMSAMTRQNADNATQANSLMDESKIVVTKAESSMEEMSRAMKEISDSGQEISKIIKTIDEIAFQTNLLALNAAVEAARAGEAGQGFAVVADEVRNLAQRAAEAAKNTAQLIESTVNKINQGNHLVTESQEAFMEVAAKSGKIAELINEIAAASAEQAQGIDQINQAISQLDKVTQQNAANAEESAAASEEMSSQAENMKDLVGQLRALVGGIKAGMVREFERRGPRAAPAGPAVKTTAVQKAPKPAAKLSNKGKEVKADKIIPFNEDFKDF